ncbi:MAG: reprolysin-like metallopeptidase [Pseudomonadota bacterium]
MAKHKKITKAMQLDQPAKTLKFCGKKSAARQEEPFVHVYGRGRAVCETDAKGHAFPGGRSPLEIVVDATEGFIPLWDESVVLRWRFQERSLSIFRDPTGAKQYLRALFAHGLQLWGDAPPVRFTEVRDRWDFEIAVSARENCSANGCTLARAFFPDSGRHDLLIYPTMFEQTLQEQIETLAHEIGHIFGLRHFFADITETRWRSEIFGEHSPFSIMNYGPKSVMTPADQADLKTLYELAWSRDLTEINGTPIQLMRPFSDFLPRMPGPGDCSSGLGRVAAFKGR